MEAASRDIPRGDGASIHLLEWSREDAGVPLVLLHGFGNDAHIWDDFAPTLAPYYRTLALDLRGHGDSDWDPEHRYDYEFHHGDLEAVTAALGIDRFVLIGHSLGGRVAMLFAGAHPERMAGLVVVDSGPEVDPRGVTRILLDVEKSAPTFASVAQYEGILARAYPAARPEVVARMARHGLRRREDGRYERKADPGFHAARAAMTPEQQEEREQATTRKLWQALAAIPCPTLVVRGAASDVLSADCAEKMAEEILPDGRLAVVPRAGHSVMTDNPEGFAEAVGEFVLG